MIFCGQSELHELSWKIDARALRSEIGSSEGIIGSEHVLMAGPHAILVKLGPVGINRIETNQLPLRPTDLDYLLISGQYEAIHGHRDRAGNLNRILGSARAGGLT